MTQLFPLFSGSCRHFRVRHCRIFLYNNFIFTFFIFISNIILSQQIDPKNIYIQFINTYPYAPDRPLPPGTATPQNVRLTKSKRRGNADAALCAGLVKAYRDAGIRAWLVEGQTTGPDKGLLVRDSTFANRTWVVVLDSQRWVIADPIRSMGELAVALPPLQKMLHTYFGIPLKVQWRPIGQPDLTGWDVPPDSLLAQALPLWSAWQLRTPAVPAEFLFVTDPIAPWCVDHPSEGISGELAPLQFTDPAQQLLVEADGLMETGFPGKTRALTNYVQAGYALSASRNLSDRKQANAALTRAAEASKAAMLEPRAFFQSAMRSLNLRRDTLSHALIGVRQFNLREMAAIRMERGRLQGDSQVQSEKIRALGKAENAATRDNALARVRRSRKTQEVRVGNLRTQLKENQQYVVEVQAVAASLLGEMPPLYRQQERLYQRRLQNMADLKAALDRLSMADFLGVSTLEIMPLCDSLNNVRATGMRLADSIKAVNDSLVDLFSLRNRLLYKAVLKTRENKNLLRSIKSANHLPGDEEKLYNAERDKLHQLYTAMQQLRKDKQLYNKQLLTWLKKQEKLAQKTARKCRLFQRSMNRLHQTRSTTARRLANDWNQYIKDTQRAGRERQTALRRVLH